LVLISPENDKEIKFFGTQRYSFDDLSPTLAVFKSRQAVRQGDFPIGEQIEVLSSFRKLRFLIPLFFRQSSIEESKIFLEQVKILFFLNDLEQIQYENKPRNPFTVPINEKGWAVFDLNIQDSIVKSLERIPKLNNLTSGSS